MDLINDSDPITISGSSFAYAFQLYGVSFDILTDPTYLKLMLTQYTNVKDDTGYTYTKATNIPYEVCGKNFNYYNQTMVKALGIDTYLCPKTEDIYVQGNIYSQNYTYFEITMARCFNLDTCKDYDTISAAISTAYLHVALVNSYFDSSNFDQPVHTYLDDRFIFDLIPGFEKEQILYIKQNEADLQDDIWHYSSNANVLQFIEVDRMDSRLSNEEKTGNLLTVRFAKDPQTDTYQRTVFSVLDFFGNIGGLNEVLERIGELIVAIFAERLFTYSIVSNLYQVDTTPTEKKVNDIQSHPHEEKNKNSNNKEQKIEKGKVYQLSEIENEAKRNNPEQAKNKII